ncbi:GGDEF domain-containing protein [Enterovibrio sp. NIFS-20-8]|nr:GGDEF domain-containing protein [Enterovibrio paralichthyis]
MEFSFQRFQIQFNELLSARHHASSFSTTRATYLRTRIIALCAIWAIMTLLWVPVDIMLLEGSNGMLVVLRVLLAVTLLTVAWATHQRNSLIACRNGLIAMTASMNIFYLLANHLLGYPHSINAFTYCYTLLPFLHVVVLTILPLTIKESLSMMVMTAATQIYVDFHSGSILSLDNLAIYWLQTVVGLLVIWAQSSKLHMMLRLYRHASLDPLTGVYNRRMLLTLAKHDFENTRTAARPYSVLLMDLDRFKRVNDRYGHYAGDLVLKAFTDSIQATLRKSDIFGRFGGEEFILFMPQCSAENAFLVADRIMTRVRDLRVVVEGVDEPLQVTTSIGISTSLNREDKLSEMLEKADIALLQAKGNGRDQSCTYESIATDANREECQKRTWVEFAN